MRSITTFPVGSLRLVKGFGSRVFNNNANFRTIFLTLCCATIYPKKNKRCCDPELKYLYLQGERLIITMQQLRADKRIIQPGKKPDTANEEKAENNIVFPEN